MTSKVFLIALLFTVATSQQDEDDGSYSPEKYETPYEEYISSVSDQASFSQQVPPLSQQSLPSQSQLQQPSLFQQQQQQPENVRQLTPASIQNPFPDNPFFQRLQNPTFQRQQIFPVVRQQNDSPQIPSFELTNSQSLERSSPLRQLNPQVTPSLRQPAPVNQFIVDDVPLTSTNYDTNDGHKRFEAVDNEGNVQGQYSYVDPNGKPITVRYSAGKDGFQVEGDHIPKASKPIDGRKFVTQTQQLPISQQQYNIQQNTNIAQFRPQVRINNQSSRQFSNTLQSEEQINPVSSLPQSTTQQFREPTQFNQQTPFTYQADGAFKLESHFNK